MKLNSPWFNFLHFSLVDIGVSLTKELTLVTQSTIRHISLQHTEEAISAIQFQCSPKVGLKLY